MYFIIVTGGEVKSNVLEHAKRGQKFALQLLNRRVVLLYLLLLYNTIPFPEIVIDIALPLFLSPFMVKRRPAQQAYLGGGRAERIPDSPTPL